MDKVDRQIINYLLKDGQMPFSQIAKQLGISTDTVIRRYNTLKEEGVIQRASIVLNLTKCGFEAPIFLLIRLCPNIDTEQTFETISHLTNVIVVAQTIGDYDLMVMAVYTGHENFDNLVDSISNLKEIEYFDICMSKKDGRIKKETFSFPTYKYYSKAYDPTITT